MSGKPRDGYLVREMTGATHFIQGACAKWTVLQLKQAIANFTGLSCDYIKLLHKSSIMTPDHELCGKYKIRPDEDVITIVERPKGGNLQLVCVDSTCKEIIVSTA